MKLLDMSHISALYCWVRSSRLRKCHTVPSWGCRKPDSTRTQLLPMFCQMTAIIYLPSKGWTESWLEIFHQSTDCVCFVFEGGTKVVVQPLLCEQTFNQRETSSQTYICPHAYADTYVHTAARHESPLVRRLPVMILLWQHECVEWICR